MPLRQFDEIVNEVGARNGVDRPRTDNEINAAIQNHALVRLDDARNRAVSAGVTGPAAQETQASLESIVRGLKVAYEVGDAMLREAVAAMSPAPTPAAASAPATASPVAASGVRGPKT